MMDVKQKQLFSRNFWSDHRYHTKPCESIKEARSRDAKSRINCMSKMLLLNFRDEKKLKFQCYGKKL